MTSHCYDLLLNSNPLTVHSRPLSGRYPRNPSLLPEDFLVSSPSTSRDTFLSKKRYAPCQVLLTKASSDSNYSEIEPARLFLKVSPTSARMRPLRVRTQLLVVKLVSHLLCEAVDPEEAIATLIETVPDIFFMDSFQFHNPAVLQYMEDQGWTSPNVQQEKVSLATC